MSIAHWCRMKGLTRLGLCDTYSPANSLKRTGEALESHRPSPNEYLHQRVFSNGPNVPSPEMHQYAQLPPTYQPSPQCEYIHQQVGLAYILQWKDRPLHTPAPTSAQMRRCRASHNPLLTRIASSQISCDLPRYCPLPRRRTPVSSEQVKRRRLS